ncbi:hypothetical protein MPH_11287 [Macrophomina phaseolina MS6]|uniref:Transcription factor fungi n=1 Tax=Macrophomina phaseolina (strain MS6) TaxID=1126212 RepID=K2QPB1_MACPH|nr:hypothetical protein MPH_11287 [Macrophomina phaseolina MS6]
MDTDLSQATEHQIRSDVVVSPAESDAASTSPPSRQQENDHTAGRGSEPSHEPTSDNLGTPAILDPGIFGPDDASVDWSKIFSPSQWQGAASLSSGINLDAFKTPRVQTPGLLNHMSPHIMCQTPDFDRQITYFPMQASADESVLFSALDHRSPLSVDISFGETSQGDENSDNKKPRDWEFWTLAQCLPFPTAIPVRRDKENISLFAENCRRWSAGDFYVQSTTTGSVEIARLTESTRERVSAIVQGVFRTASETHGIRSGPNELEFLPLPPTDALYAFLMNYIHHCDPYYPFVPKKYFNPNQLVSTGSVRGATLLLLLMIGFGALMDPAPYSRQIVCGLMEICRLSHMERTNKYAAVILRNIHFFSAVEAPWHNTDDERSIEQLWLEWTDHETRSRLIYTWVIVDQELSLFYDTPPLLSITELEGAVPDDESLWLAPNASSWQQALNPSSNSSPSATIAALCARPRTSLRDLFHLLATNDTSRADTAHLTALHLRLLLYPLHALVSSFHQSLALSASTCTAHHHHPPKLPKTMTQMSTMLQHAEIKSLLDRWHGLSNTHAATCADRALTHSNLVLYHLITLNLFTSFKEIEAHARHRAAASTAATTTTTTTHPRDAWLCEPEELLAHCGQALRLLRAMDAAKRPVWVEVSS